MVIKIKKTALFVLLITLLFLISIPAAASEDNQDNQDDLTHLTGEIIETANDLFADKLSRPIVQDDIRFENAFKIYVGVNIFASDTMNIHQMIAEFGDDGYLYELPVYIGDDTVIISISKGRPLDESVEFTESERQEVLSRVGKWSPTGFQFYSSKTIDYISVLEQKLGEPCDNAVLVGGLPNFRFAVALLPNEKGIVEGLVPVRDVPGEDKISEFRSASGIYDYGQIKEYMNQQPELKPGEIAPYGFSDTDPAKPLKNTVLILVIGGLCIMAGSFLFFVIRRRRH